MGKYTSFDSTWIDAEIEYKLASITEIIVRSVRNVRSVFLVGGFGKGEGSVKITEGRQIECLRDFDLAVIVDRTPNGKTVHSLNDEIHRCLGLHRPKQGHFRFSNFVVDIRFLRKGDLIYPDIWFYDLKSASHLLYGEDTRFLIPWGKEHIPLSSGLRILFEKVCGLLGVFSPAFLDAERLSNERRELLISECYKTFVEICTSLCILAHKYESRYADRARMFRELYFLEFPELARVLIDLPDRVAKCTQFKLRPDFAAVYDDPVDLWFTTKKYLLIVLSTYISKYLGLAGGDWNASFNRTREISREYYKPFLNSLVIARLGASSQKVIQFASLLYQSLTNIEYSYVVTLDTRRIYLRPLTSWYVSPSLKFFQAGVMILFSLKRGETMEREHLKDAARWLSQCIPVEISTWDVNGWDALRRHFLRAYSLYRGFHFVK